jgi:drug/metabolite transporter (DMT)-like permease
LATAPRAASASPGPAPEGQLLPVFELTLAMVLWASLYAAGKPVLAVLPSTLVALARVVVAFFVLGAVVVIRGRGREAVEELIRRPLDSALLGLFSFFLSSILMLMALERLPASVVGLIVNSSPLWLSLAVVVAKRPEGSGRLLLGAAISLVGVGIVLFRAELSSATGVPVEGLDPLGAALAVLNSIVVAANALWTKRVLSGRDPLVMTCLGCFWGALPLIAMVWLGDGLMPLAATTGLQRGLLLYLGVGCTAVNFALFNHALKRMSAERASAFQYMVPVLSAVMAFAFLGEPLTWPLLVGGVAVLGGIALTQRRRYPVRRPSERAAELAEGTRGRRG